MSRTRVGFHRGELAVQQRAGVSDDAARLAPMLGAPSPPAGLREFVAQRDVVFLTARDGHGTLWTSAVHGAPGFCSLRDGTLVVVGVPGPGDPLADLPVGSLVGVLLVDFTRRRRVRVNGLLTAAHPMRLEVAVDQAFGNCPRYIPRRLADPAGPPAVAAADPAATGDADGPRWSGTVLGDEQVGLVRRAESVVLGTAHPTHGADSSHRGGAPGFLRVEPDRSLWWPDYPGNNLFNSLGNILVDPTAALLIIDAPAGRSLQITGEADLDWTAAGAVGDDGSTGRRVRLRPTGFVERTIPRRRESSEPSRDNPTLA